MKLSIICENPNSLVEKDDSFEICTNNIKEHVYLTYFNNEQGPAFICIVPIAHPLLGMLALLDQTEIIWMIRLLQTRAVGMVSHNDWIAWWEKSMDAAYPVDTPERLARRQEMIAHNSAISSTWYVKELGYGDKTEEYLFMQDLNRCPALKDYFTHEVDDKGVLIIRVGFAPNTALYNKYHQQPTSIPTH